MHLILHLEKQKWHHTLAAAARSTAQLHQPSLAQEKFDYALTRTRRETMKLYGL